MSKEIEDRLRARYTLIDKTDPAAILAAQQAGLPINDDGEMVGETDTKGFSVGPTSTSQPAASSVVAARKKDARKAKTRDRTRYQTTRLRYVYSRLKTLTKGELNPPPEPKEINRNVVKIV